MTVGQLKEKIFEKMPYITGLCTDENLKLIFTDKMLEGDTSLLSDYGIQHMSVIHLVLKVPGGGGPLPPSRDDGLGDKEGETRRSMERLMLDL